MTLFFNPLKYFKKTKGFSKDDFHIDSNTIYEILKECGFHDQDNKIVELLPDKLNKSLNNLNEVCMFLAHTIHETGGFKYREEILGVENPEKAQKTYYHSDNIKDKSYHGRGILMITWVYNYRSASLYLGKSNELVLNPEKVSTDDQLCIDTAIWYWVEVVRKSQGVGDNNFGASTMAINGSIESSGEGKKLAENRFKLYQKISTFMKIKHPASK